MKNTKTILMCLMALSLFGCKKDDDSAYQPKGNYGNDLITSQTFSVNSWSSDSWQYYIGLNVPSLTTAVQNNGAVQVYFSIDYGTTWIGLPWTDVNTVDYFMEYIYQTNYVEVKWIYNGAGIGTNPNAYYNSTIQVKVVTLSPAGRLANPDLDLKNYSEVVKHFPQVAKNK